MSIRIQSTNMAIEREPLASPFGFKGGYLSELWQMIALLKSERGNEGIGLGVQSILWSDSDVFSKMDEQAGNEAMAGMTRFALEQAKNIQFETPFELLDQLLPEVYAYGKKLTDSPHLRETFALNALVPVDHAAWMLYAAEQGLTTFDQLIPENYKPALSERQQSLASIPLVSYGDGEEQITQLLDAGYFLLKVKIGADPDGDGDQDKMLAWDQKRLAMIHEIASRYECAYTENKKIPYYLDANGRYESKERLLKLLDYADQIGALEQIILVEEPFPEQLKVEIHDVPVTVAADESLHSVQDAIERIQLGYKAMTLKPIAKTMSMTLKIAKVAYDQQIPCFCADLTVNPLMVDWNKNVAARLAPLPGLTIGLLESNGAQNYAYWDRLKTYHPSNQSAWISPNNGLYELTDDFYLQSGGVFKQSSYYRSLV